MKGIIEFFPRLINLSAVASIVILFVLVARLILKRAPKIFSYALWAIVLVRLLIPISIQSPLSAIPVTQTTNSAEINAALPEIEFELPSDRQENILSLQQSIETGSAYVHVSRSLEPTGYLAIAWMVGMGIMLVYSVISYLKIRRKLKVVIPLRGNIFIADDIKSPFVIGLILPKIYLPCNLGEKEQEYIILHEQHHIRRFDHIFKALAFLALTIHWFNPLVWAAFILASKDMEMSCDEAVIRKLGSDVRADYSASLLTLATGRRIIAGTPLAFGEGDTKGRIKNLGKRKKPAIWVIVIAVILCAVLAVCLLTNQARSTENVGIAWYYGNVTAQDADGSSPLIHVLCNDGNVRVFDYEAGNEDIPEDLVGKQGKLCARVQTTTGNLLTTQVEIVPDILYDDLESAIQNAILEHHQHTLHEDTLTCASFFTLASEGNGPAGRDDIQTVTEYGIVYHQDYTLENGSLVEDGGCNVPTVLTFRINDDGKYILAEYWEPRDGNYYPEDIRAKYPAFIWPDTQEHGYEQKIAIFQQVMDGFGVGTDVVIDHLLTDICERAQWADGFTSLMDMCDLQRELLSYYGTDTLQYCFKLFETGSQNDLKGQVMAYVCSEILDSMGEDPLEDWSWQKSGQDWFGAVTENSKDGSGILGQILPHLNWGITMKAENATPNGATIILTQEGGYLPNRLFYGSDFNIQKYEESQWVDVEPLQELIWTTVAYSVPLDDSICWNVDWSKTFGTLEPGLYRFCKDITDQRAAGDNDNATFYAEFEIS